MKKNNEIKPGDFALIEWNGGLYTKSQHYHVVDVENNRIRVRIPGSYISLVIPKKNIKIYEPKELIKQ
jgi:hypothetical protein